MTLKWESMLWSNWPFTASETNGCQSFFRKGSANNFRIAAGVPRGLYALRPRGACRFACTSKQSSPAILCTDENEFWFFEWYWHFKCIPLPLNLSRWIYINVRSQYRIWMFGEKINENINIMSYNHAISHYPESSFNYVKIDWNGSFT